MKKRSIFTLLLLLVIFICASCNNTAYTISIDEMKNGVVTPSVTEAKGGETVIDNLQTLCADCNLGKSNLE